MSAGEKGIRGEEKERKVPVPIGRASRNCVVENLPNRLVVYAMATRLANFTRTIAHTVAVKSRLASADLQIRYLLISYIVYTL